MDYKRLGKETENACEGTDFDDFSDAMDLMNNMDEEAETRALEEILEIPESCFLSSAGRRSIDRTMNFYKAYSLLKKICVGRFEIIRERITPMFPGSGGLIIEAERIRLNRSDIKMLDRVRCLSDGVKIEGTFSGRVRICFKFN